MWNSHIELALPGGETHVIANPGHKYICSREDVLGWLKNVGFAVEEEFGGCDRRPFAGKAGWDIIWAGKR